MSLPAGGFINLMMSKTRHPSMRYTICYHNATRTDYGNANVPFSEIPTS